MANTLYWLQCGACGGDTMATLGVESPDVLSVLKLLDVEVLWHPSLSNGSGRHHQALLEAMTSGEQKVDVLVVEGSIIRGPGGTGMYDTMDGKPKKDLLARLARRAHFVVAAGTCASFGGIGATGDVESSGAQFLKREKGGLLGPSFTTGSGLPVINLPGCPVPELQSIIFNSPLFTEKPIHVIRDPLARLRVAQVEKCAAEQPSRMVLRQP